MASISSSTEPQARYYHAAVSVEQKLFVWGGDGGHVSLGTTTVERFDVSSTSWQEPRQIRGHTIPDGLRDMAVVFDGKKAYMFGGWSGPRGCQRLNNTLHEVDLMSLECRELVPNSRSNFPREKSNSGGVKSGPRSLLFFGGCTGGINDRTDEVHLFDLDTKTWIAMATTGEKPPPLSHHKVTKIDQHRAVLFGGYDGKSKQNDTYILDMDTWHWTKMRIMGKKPSPRDDHALFCIAGPLTGEHDPLLMVVGGFGDGLAGLSDAWLLDVTRGLWKEVNLPTDITQRYGHSATMLTGSNFRVVVLFGGKKTMSIGDVISETKLLFMSQRRGSWVVERVVSPRELGKEDNTLREQLRRLQSPTSKESMREIEGLLREERSRRQEAEHRALAMEDGRRAANQMVRDLERRCAEIERVANERVRGTEERLRKMGGDLKRINLEKRLSESRLTEVEQRQHAEIDVLSSRLRQAEMVALHSPINVFWKVEREEVNLSELELGSGGWASVKVAEFRGLQVAAKCLHSSIISEYNQRLFLREMHIGATLRHPHLVQFIGATWEGEAMILTELMTTSLRAILQRGPLNTEQISSVSRHVASALNYMHLMCPDPILHRDVSSANILLNLGPNNTWIAKLSDYGSANFARLVASPGPGNPSYAAPEASYGALHSPKMDVYSFGVLLIEMATHEFPDPDTRDVQITQITLPGLLQVVSRCVKHNPIERPSIHDILPQL